LESQGSRVSASGFSRGVLAFHAPGRLPPSLRVEKITIFNPLDLYRSWPDWVQIKVFEKGVRRSLVRVEGFSRVALALNTPGRVLCALQETW